MQDWPGDLGFDVRVEQSTRSKDPHYSVSMKKLFVNQKRTVNVLFTVTSASVLPQLDVRAVAVYTRFVLLSVFARPSPAASATESIVLIW